MRHILPEYGFTVPSATAGWLDEWKERWDLAAELFFICVHIGPQTSSPVGLQIVES